MKCMTVIHVSRDLSLDEENADPSKMCSVLNPEKLLVSSTTEEKLYLTNLLVK